MELEFAIVGCGRIAQRHAEQIIKQGKLIAVCDIIPEKANKMAEKYNCAAFEDIDSLLESGLKPIVISICSPNGLHALHSIKSLEAGFNVLCEKPLCISSSDGMDMIATAKRANKKLFVVKSSRYTPEIVAIKNLIDAGKLGKIYSFQLNCVWNRPDIYYENSWKGTLNLDGGTLFTQFSHYIDVLIWLLGEVQEIAGFRKNISNKNIEFEDTGAIALMLKNGAIGTVHYSVNAHLTNHEISLTIVAEKATIKLGGEYLNKISYQNPQLIEIDNLKEGNLPNDYGAYRGSMSNHAQVYENIINALNGIKSETTDGESALKTVDLIERIYNQIML